MAKKKKPPTEIHVIEDAESLLSGMQDAASTGAEKSDVSVTEYLKDTQHKFKKPIMEMTLGDVLDEVNIVHKKTKGKKEYTSLGKKGTLGNTKLSKLIPQFSNIFGDIKLRDVNLMEFVQFGFQENENLRMYDLIDAAFDVKGKEKDAISKRQQLRFILGSFKSIIETGFDASKHENVLTLLPSFKAEEAATTRFFRQKRTVPPGTKAGLAIIFSPQKFRAFYEGLQVFKEANPHLGAIVDDIVLNTLTGFRPNVITHLREHNIVIHDDGSMSIKVLAEVQGMKAASVDSEGGKFISREGAAKKVFTIPLVPHATQIVRERLAQIQLDLDAGIKNPDRLLFYMPNEKGVAVPVKTSDTTGKVTSINDVLSSIEVEGGIIEDQNDWDYKNNVGRKHNTLHVPGLNKSGAELLRNWNTHLWYEAGVPTWLIDIAQARPVTSRSNPAVVELLNYLVFASEQKNEILSEALGGPTTTFLRDKVYGGQGDMFILDEDLEKTAEIAKSQHKEVQAARALERSRISTAQQEAVAVVRADIKKELLKDFPQLKGKTTLLDSASEAFSSLEQYTDTFRNQDFVQEAIKSGQVDNVLELWNANASDPTQQGLIQRFQGLTKRGARITPLMELSKAALGEAGVEAFVANPNMPDLEIDPITGYPIVTDEELARIDAKLEAAEQEMLDDPRIHKSKFQKAMAKAAAAAKKIPKGGLLGAVLGAVISMPLFSRVSQARRYLLEHEDEMSPEEVQSRLEQIEDLEGRGSWSLILETVGVPTWFEDVLLEEEDKFARATPEFQKYMQEGGGDKARAAMDTQIEGILSHPIIEDKAVSPRHRYAKHPSSVAKEAELKFQSEVEGPVLAPLRERERTKRVEYGPAYAQRRAESIREESLDVDDVSTETFQDLEEEYQGFAMGQNKKDYGDEGKGLVIDIPPDPDRYPERYRTN